MKHKKYPLHQGNLSLSKVKNKPFETGFYHAKTAQDKGCGLRRFSFFYNRKLIAEKRFCKFRHLKIFNCDLTNTVLNARQPAKPNVNVNLMMRLPTSNMQATTSNTERSDKKMERCGKKMETSMFEVEEGTSKTQCSV